MKLRIVWVGRTKSSQLADTSADYIGRIDRFLPLDIIEIREPKGDDTHRVKTEGEKILAALRPSDRVIGLDPKGKSWSSEQFAGFLQQHMTSDPRRLTFIIGGYAGIPAAVKNRADLLWSLSPLTFTHELTRVLLLEQIYRALSILHKLPYAK